MAEIGRPTVMTGIVLGKLDEAFLMGFNDREACLYADISPSTLYDYCKENPSFSERKELLKENLNMMSKKNIYEELKKGDKDMSKWYKERRDTDFIPKKATDLTSGGKPLTLTFDNAFTPETEGNS